jgi:hypothetical protein
MGDSSNFEKGQIVVGRLARASVIKTATLLRVWDGKVSKVVLTYTDHEKTTAKRNRVG